MRGWLLSLALVLAGVSVARRCCTVPQMTGAIAGGTVLPTGWTWGQEDNTLLNGTVTCSASDASCEIPTGDFIPTQAGSIWIIAADTSSSQTISSVSGGGGTWVTSSNFTVYNSTVEGGLAAAYNLSGTTATTGGITVTLNSAPSATWHLIFIEIVPPPSYPASFDNYATADVASCSTACTGAAPTLTATDAVIHLALSYNYPSGWNAWSAPYYLTSGSSGDTQEGVGLNIAASSGTPTYDQGTGTGEPFIDLALAFKSSAGNFSVNAPFSLVDLTTSINISNINDNYISCSSSGCSVTVPSSTSGDLYYIQANTEGVALTSATLGSTSFTIPSGTNTCQIAATSEGDNYELNCAYLLSAPSGQTTVTMYTASSVNLGYTIWHLHRTSGSWSLDTQASSSGTVTSNPCQGPSLTLSGTNDVIFTSIIDEGGISSVGSFMIPYDLGWLVGLGTNGLGNLNTTNGTAPYYTCNISGGSETVAFANIAFK